MNINEFFEIAQNFFDAINQNFCEEYVEQEESNNEFWQILEDFFNEINPPPDYITSDN